MALGIDTRNLLEQWMPRLEELLASANLGNRYQVHRVYACATILSQDEAEIRDVSIHTPSFSVTQEALDWQANQDEDLNERDVYHHLVQMGAAPSSTSLPPDELYSFPNAERHVTSAQSPTFAVRAKGRPASSFRRQSFRLCTLEVYNDDEMYPGYHLGATALEKLDATTVRKVPKEWWESWLFEESPEIIWARTGDPSAVLWHVQVDILDMLTRNPTPSHRRRRYGACLQVSPGGGEEPSSSRVDPVSEAKRFKGVRYRPNRKSFVAETRLPNRKNKVSFGDFKSSKEAARAIDAAFYHYGIRDKVNFADTPQILSKKPTPDGMNEADTLRLVKEQAKWLASWASTLQSSPSSATAVAASTAPLELVLSEPSRAGCTAVPTNSGFPPFSDVFPSSLLVSYGSVGGTDNGVFQPPSPWEFSMDAMAGSSVSRGWLENTLEPLNDVAKADHDAGVANELCEFGEPGQSVVQVVWSVDSSGVEQPACDEFQSVSVDLLGMSSPGPNLFQTESPRGFQDDVADQLLQQQLSIEDAGNEQLIPQITGSSGMVIYSSSISEFL